MVILYSYVGLPEGNGRNWDLRSYLDALLGFPMGIDVMGYEISQVMILKIMVIL